MHQRLLHTGAEQQGGSAGTVVSVSVNVVSYPANFLTGSKVIGAGARDQVTVIITGFTAGQTVDIQLSLSNGNTLTITLVVS